MNIQESVQLIIKSFFGLIVLCFFLGCERIQTAEHNQTPSNQQEEVLDPNIIPLNTLKRARAFSRERGFNTQIAFFCDMRIRSGKKRFFVVDLMNDSVLFAGLVAHGHCQKYAQRSADFSNELGSNCTATGRYKIGGKYNGQFGTAYKLFGLDSSNSNAFDRFIVLHGYPCVPNEEQLLGICRSEGCPTVSPEFLKTIEPVIDQSTKPMLLWIYN